MKQASQSMTEYFDKGKKTKREKLLTVMDKMVPWARLYGLIEPHFPKSSPAGARPPLPMGRLFRFDYCLQQWYNLSDPGAEEALIASITTPVRGCAEPCGGDCGRGLDPLTFAGCWSAMSWPSGCRARSTLALVSAD